MNLDLPYKRMEKCSIVLALGGDETELWTRFRAKTRNSIRKGEKSGLILSRDKSYLPDFYEAYAKRMAMKNVTIYPLSFFENLFRSLKERIELYVAIHEGKPVGGLIVVRTAKSAQYVYAGNLPGTEPLCITHFLLWEAIKDCVGRGIELFDMSESTKGGGVYRFKTLFGGEPRQVYYYDILTPLQETKSPSALASEAQVHRPILARLAGRVTLIANKMIPLLPPDLQRLILVWQKKFGQLV
jgi:lipid II:glycine glycyltransferase (peptidoglycan interpeptide bridge formation enzyme)